MIDFNVCDVLGNGIEFVLLNKIFSNNLLNDWVSNNFTEIITNNFIFGRITVEQIAESSQKAREALEQVWVHLSTSKLYSAILSISRLTIVVALIFYSYQLYRKVLDDLDYRPIIASIILPLILIVLLGNPSNPKQSPIWNLSLQFRGIIYKLDETIMDGMVSDTSLDAEVRRMKLSNYIRTASEEAIDQCLAIADEQAKINCFKDKAEAEIEDLYNLHQQVFGNSPVASAAWMEEMKNAIAKKDLSEAQAKESGNLIGSVARGLGDAILDAIGLVITVFSIVTNYTIEAALVLATIVAPFAVGVSLFPIPTKPIYTWILGYMGIGIWKIGNNVLAGLGAYIMNRTDDFAGFNYIIFAVLIGVFAPVLSAMLGSFSALSLGQGIINTTQATVRTTINYAGAIMAIGRLGKR